MENQTNSGNMFYQCEYLTNTTWTRYEDKLFETALVNVPENIEGRWQKIADAVPGKTVEQVRARYDELLHDLDEIESGRVELPRYPDVYYVKKSFVSSDYHQSTSRKGERKKGYPWTEDEHRKFLKGLRECGKGDWRSISRKYVVTRTPTQVASHAQKYFNRQASSGKEKRKRASIHDITIDVNTTDTTMVVQPPPLTNIYSDHGGALPPQMGYQHQINFGFPN